MRCTLLKIAASFAKCWFLFHLKKPFVTHCLVMLYLNKQHFVPYIDFSLTERHTVQKHICWRLFAVLPDTKTFPSTCDQTAHAKKHLYCSIFCSKFALRNCDWRKFRLRVQVFDTKTICTRFSRRCKNSFAPSFRINFYLKIYFWIDVCNAFSVNRTGKRNVNFTATADLRLRR